MSMLAPDRQQWPEALPAFRDIARSWDSAHDLCSARILPGEFYVTRSDEMITTVLGSCVSACIRDPDTGVGGMNHFMLPGDSGKPHDKWGGEDSLVTRYGVAAMETLINEILKQGSRRNRLELKLFGGGRVLAMDTMNVGQRNIDFVRSFVDMEGMLVAAEDLGGPYPRKVNFFPRSGKVMVKRLRSLQNRTVAAQEKQYESTLGAKEIPGEIDLFD